MIEVLLIVLAAAIVVSGIVGFAHGFLRNFADRERAWEAYRGRFFRQLLVGALAAVLIGLLAPTVTVVLLASVVVSVLIGPFVF